MMHKALAAVLMTLILPAAARAQADRPAPTHDKPGVAANVVLVMIDGVRWQEVFTGADDRHFTKEAGKIEQPEPIRREFWRETPDERRAVLMPFLWTTVAAHGQIYGNQTKGSVARITNSYGVSYPGYAEANCGIAEPIIKDNRVIPNPNVSVFEFLNSRDRFQGKAAIFGNWTLFTSIFNQARSNLPIDDGVQPFTAGTVTPDNEVINTIRREGSFRWGSATMDAMLFRSALPWIRANKPRAIFVCLGDTDEWAHEGYYAEYLRAMRRADGYIAELWSVLQSMPEYKDSTALIITTDHGRGDERTSPTDWNNHSLPKHPGCENIWVAAIGPGIEPLGERTDTGEIKQAQIAATVAAIVGEDFLTAQPKAAPPVSGIVGKKPD